MFYIVYLEIGGSTVVTYKNDTYGQITSPGYPGNYPNNANYIWIIRTGHRRAKVEIKIIYMDTREWNPCDDYLLVWRLIVKYKSSLLFGFGFN